MKFYSHRGNIEGEDQHKENSPDYIDRAIGLGFDVEIDVRAVGQDIYLGHDFPMYKTTYKWLWKRQEKLLIHMKDFASLKILFGNGFHYFCHSNDPYTITSRYALWLHDISLPADKNCIVPLIGLDHVESYNNHDVNGVCSDYVEQCRNKFGR